VIGGHSRTLAQGSASYPSPTMRDLAARVAARFRWVEGHADMWSLFADASLFEGITSALAGPFGGAKITKVAGIEARGFILGGAVARELETGFVAIRKETGLFPGRKLTRITASDYRGNSSLFRLQRASFSPGDRVLVVDDWIETGSQVAAAQALIEEVGAEFVGVSVIVDQLPRDSTPMLGKFAALIRAEALGSSAY
jgi:adenine phosphoribosyltransferase